MVTHHVPRIALPFPNHFVFKLTWEEMVTVSQTVISLAKLGFSKQVRAFTQHGTLKPTLPSTPPLVYNTAMQRKDSQHE
jgi:hypothetical protein